MKNASVFIALAAISTLGQSACDQTKADFPETVEQTGVCGPWYPGGGGDAGVGLYAVEKDSIFPCFVWESAHVNNTDTWLNVGELYLAAKHGSSSAKAMIIAVVGVDCSACAALVQALGEMEHGFSEAAVMLALTHGPLGNTDLYPLDEAVWAMKNKGWPEQWHVTNDQENHFPVEDYNGIPWVVVVRLSDMKVVERSNVNYTASNVDELLDFVQGLE